MPRPRSAVRGLGAAHDERRRDILEAVFTIVDTAGADQVSIRRVADIAGVSLGRVQHYFPSKDALLFAAFTAINDHGTRRVHARLADEGSADNPAAILEVVLAELIPNTAADIRLFRIGQAFEAHALTRADLRSRVTEGYDQLATLLALLLRKSLSPATTDKASIDPTPLLMEAHGLLAHSIGLSVLTVTTNLPSREARTLSAAHLRHTMARLRNTESSVSG